MEGDKRIIAKGKRREGEKTEETREMPEGRKKKREEKRRKMGGKTRERKKDRMGEKING